MCFLRLLEDPNKKGKKNVFHPIKMNACRIHRERNIIVNYRANNKLISIWPEIFREVNSFVYLLEAGIPVLRPGYRCFSCQCHGVAVA